MINCNPETVSTDYDTSDRLYFEPLTYEDVMNVIEAEKQSGEVVGDAQPDRARHARVGEVDRRVDDERAIREPEHRRACWQQHAAGHADRGAVDLPDIVGERFHTRSMDRDVTARGRAPRGFLSEELTKWGPSPFLARPPHRHHSRPRHRGERALVVRDDGDAALAALRAELDRSRARGEDRVVLADAGAVARLEAGAALADDDLAAGHGLAGEHLHAEALRVRVAAVAAGAESLLMSHPMPSSSSRP